MKNTRIYNKKMILAAYTQNKDGNIGTFNRNTLNQADHKK